MKTFVLLRPSLHSHSFTARPVYYIDISQFVYIISSEERLLF